MTSMGFVTLLIGALQLLQADGLSVSRLDSSSLHATPTDVKTTAEVTKEDLFVDWMSSNSLDEVPYPGIKLEVEGTIPDYVVGTYIKNGAGVYSTSNQRYLHAFDGLAKLQSFQIGPGSDVNFVCTFVDSFIKKELLDNDRIPPHISVGPVEPPFSVLSKILYSLQFDNACVNVEEISQSGVFCAVTDAAVRMEFDPRTLETIGRRAEDRIEGIQGIAQFTTAHSKVSKRRGVTFNYFNEIGLDTYTHVVRTNKDLTRTSIGKVATNGKISYIHEISITENYAVVCSIPLYFDPEMVTTNKGLLQSLRYEPSDGTKIHVFDLEGNKPVETFETEPFWCYHHVNAYEDGAKVVLDLLGYEDVGFANGPHGYLLLDNMKTEEGRMKQMRESTLWRFTMDLDDEGRSVKPEKRVMIDPKSNLPLTIELAVVSPEVAQKPYQYLYGFTGFNEGRLGYMDWSILKQNAQSGKFEGSWFEEFAYPGEPFFVPNPDGTEEDDGVLLCSVYNSRRRENFLLVLDAKSMQEVARAYTGTFLPPGFHGKFFPK